MSPSEGRTISQFTGGVPADHETIAAAIVHFAVLFPTMPASFWNEATRAIRAARWPIERLRYAYNQVRTNHKYTTITIADILGIDKAYKVYRYDETDGSHFIKLEGIDRWAYKADYLEHPELFRVHPNALWIAEEWRKELEKKREEWLNRSTKAI